MTGSENKDHQEVNIEEELVHGFLKIGHMMRYMYEGKTSQNRILIILLERGGMSQKKLTEYLGIQPGSASEILAKLEKAGLILRTPGTIDRRTSDIILTEAGIQMAQEALEQRQSRHEQMFTCLSEEEKQELFEFLEKLGEDWKQRFAIPADHRRQGGGRKHPQKKETKGE